jgi:hypothetical protein
VGGPSGISGMLNVAMTDDPAAAAAAVDGCQRSFDVSVVLDLSWDGRPAGVHVIVPCRLVSALSASSDP